MLPSVLGNKTHISPNAIPEIAVNVKAQMSPNFSHFHRQHHTYCYQVTSVCDQQFFSYCAGARLTKSPRSNLCQT